jgi:hypothetical protein
VLLPDPVQDPGEDFGAGRRTDHLGPDDAVGTAVASGAEIEVVTDVGVNPLGPRRQLEWPGWGGVEGSGELGEGAVGVVGDAAAELVGGDRGGFEDDHGAAGTQPRPRQGPYRRGLPGSGRGDRRLHPQPGGVEDSDQILLALGERPATQSRTR